MCSALVRSYAATHRRRGTQTVSAGACLVLNDVKDRRSALRAAGASLGLFCDNVSVTLPPRQPLRDVRAVVRSALGQVPGRAVQSRRARGCDRGHDAEGFGELIPHAASAAGMGSGTCPPTPGESPSRRDSTLGIEGSCPTALAGWRPTGRDFEKGRRHCRRGAL